MVHCIEGQHKRSILLVPPEYTKTIKQKLLDLLANTQSYDNAIDSLDWIEITFGISFNESSYQERDIKNLFAAVHFLTQLKDLFGEVHTLTFLSQSIGCLNSFPSCFNKIAEDEFFEKISQLSTILEFIKKLNAHQSTVQKLVLEMHSLFTALENKFPVSNNIPQELRVLWHNLFCFTIVFKEFQKFKIYPEVKSKRLLEIVFSEQSLPVCILNGKRYWTKLENYNLYNYFNVLKESSALLGEELHELNSEEILRSHLFYLRKRTFLICNPFEKKIIQDKISHMFNALLSKKSKELCKEVRELFDIQKLPFVDKKHLEMQKKFIQIIGRVKRHHEKNHLWVTPLFKNKPVYLLQHEWAGPMSSHLSSFLVPLLIFKEGKRKAAMEILAHDFSLIFGFENLVPNSYLTTLGMATGGLQEIIWENSLETLRTKEPERLHAIYNELSHETFLEAFFFEMVIGDSDLHRGNLSLNEEKICFYDFDRCFAPNRNFIKDKGLTYTPIVCALMEFPHADWLIPENLRSYYLIKILSWKTTCVSQFVNYLNSHKGKKIVSFLHEKSFHQYRLKAMKKRLEIIHSQLLIAEKLTARQLLFAIYPVCKIMHEMKKKLDENNQVNPIIDRSFEEVYIDLIINLNFKEIHEINNALVNNGIFKFQEIIQLKEQALQLNKINRGKIIDLV